MAIQTYYDGLGDVDLAKDVIARNPDIYIQKYEYVGSGVLGGDTAGDLTLTPATSPVWVADELISTVARNLIIVDDNEKAATAKITDNDAASVTFAMADTKLEEDGVTIADVNIGSTYNMYVLTPSSVSTRPYGPFWGYVEGAELQLNDEFKKFYYSSPQQLKFKDMNKREGVITGGHVNFTNENIMKDLFGGVAYGNQTSQYSIGIGSVPSTSNYFRLTFKTTDREDGRTVYIICRKCQFELTGNILQQSESGHFMAGFNADIIVDGFSPTNADMIQVIRSDS
jgi:hypothetical protein